MLNDTGKPKVYPDMAQEEWCLPKLLYQVILQDYWKNMQEGVEYIKLLAKGKPCIVWKVPYEVDLFQFTGEEMLQLALDSAKSLVATLDA